MTYTHGFQYSSLFHRSIINRRMFYSPTKEFVRFSTYRTAQINALRQRIQKEKVTPDQINTTQLRLQKLKKQYEGLQKQEHSDLKEVLQSSQLAIVDLQKEITVGEKECISKKQQLQELQKIKAKMQQHGEEEEEKLKNTIFEKERLQTACSTNQEHLLQGEAQIEHCSRQLEKQRKIKDDILAAQAEVSKKWQELRGFEESCQKEKSTLCQKVAAQRSQLLRLQKELQLGDKQVQKQKHLKENSQIQQKFFEEKIMKLQNQKVLAKENQQAEGVQQQIGECLKAMLESVGSENQRVEKEEISYQRKIKEVLMRVNEEQQSKCKLQEKVAIARANLRLFKQKNESLKSKMNAIFKNDSELVKAIASKKVYPHVKPEVVEIVKKSAAQPLESKENQVLVIAKQPKPETPIEPRLFSQTNRVL